MIDCPDWSDDRVEHASATLRIQANVAAQELLGTARSRILRDVELRTWHRRTFTGLAPHPDYVGNYRQTDQTRPCLQYEVEVSGIAGCPSAQVTSRMQSLIAGFEQGVRLFELAYPTLTPLQRAERTASLTATLVGNIIRIHPFVNGNGRTSRMAWNWVLVRFDLPIRVKIAIRPQEPYGTIMAHCMRNDDTHLYLHILSGLGGSFQAGLSAS